MRLSLKKKKERAFERRIQEVESLKSSGIKVSRHQLFSLGRSYYENNKEVINEGEKEMKVLNLKKFFRRRGWNFPPRIAEPHTADLINSYYGKHLVDYK